MPLMFLKFQPTMYMIRERYISYSSHSGEQKIMLDKTVVLKLLAALYGFI